MSVPSWFRQAVLELAERLNGCSVFLLLCAVWTDNKPSLNSKTISIFVNLPPVCNQELNQAVPSLQ